MTRMEETEALRARTDVHYNCCQSVLVPFADLCGLDKETAFRLGANFGSGMRHGSTCGAVTGALMVLGLAGKGADEATALMRRFREKNQVLDCANLLRLAKERGEERKCHCDRMVYEAVELLEEAGLGDTPDSDLMSAYRFADLAPLEAAAKRAERMLVELVGATASRYALRMPCAATFCASARHSGEV